MKTAVPKKPIYDMSPQELKELLRPTADEVLQKKWDNDGYIAYYDENTCASPDIMVHEYKDHRELVRVDANGKTTLLKKLNNEHERTTSADHNSGTERRR